MIGSYLLDQLLTYLLTYLIILLSDR